MEKGKQKLSVGLEAVFARTALILPFSLGDTHASPHHWAHALLRRRVPHHQHTGVSKVKQTKPPHKKKQRSVAHTNLE